MNDCKECCICLENSEEKLLKFACCDHALHGSCMKDWFIANTTCPICREVVGGFEVVYKRVCLKQGCEKNFCKNTNFSVLFSSGCSRLCRLVPVKSGLLHFENVGEDLWKNVEIKILRAHQIKDCLFDLKTRMMVILREFSFKNYFNEDTTSMEAVCYKFDSPIHCTQMFTANWLAES